MEAITNTTNLGTAGDNVLSTTTSKFGDNPFLSLLIAEMKTQTPLDPVDNGSFMQQLASYSSMSEQKQLNDNLLKLLDFQGALARMQGLSQSSALLGKNVTYVTEDGKTTAQGVVDSVFVNDSGEVRLRMGDVEIGLKQISGITDVGTDQQKQAAADQAKKDQEAKV